MVLKKLRKRSTVQFRVTSDTNQRYSELHCRTWSHVFFSRKLESLALSYSGDIPNPSGSEPVRLFSALWSVFSGESILAYSFFVEQKNTKCVPVVFSMEYQ